MLMYTLEILGEFGPNIPNEKSGHVKWDSIQRSGIGFILFYSTLAAGF